MIAVLILLAIAVALLATELRLMFSPSGDCCTVACQAKIVFHVKVCDSSGFAVNGATITVKNGGGTTVDTGTTDSSGDYTTGDLPCAAYTWTATLTGWNGDSGSATIVTDGVDVTVNSFGMRPTSVHLTDGVVSASAMTWNGTTWQLCYNTSQSGATYAPAPPLFHCTATPGTVSVRVQYGLSCNLKTMTQGVTYGSDDDNCVHTLADGACGGTPGGCATNTFDPKSASGTVNPLALSFAFNTTFSGLSCGGWTISLPPGPASITL